MYKKLQCNIDHDDMIIWDACFGSEPVGRSGKRENNNKKIDRQAATTCVRNTVTKIF